VQLSSRSDEELVTLARRGWPAPFAVLLHRHGAAVRAAMAGRPDPDAAVVRTFTRAMQQLRRVDPTAPVEPWLLALAPGRRGRTAPPAEPGPPLDGVEVDAWWAQLAPRWPRGRTPRPGLPTWLRWTLLTVILVALAVVIPYATITTGQRSDVPDDAAEPLRAALLEPEAPAVDDTTTSEPSDPPPDELVADEPEEADDAATEADDAATEPGSTPEQPDRTPADPGAGPAPATPAPMAPEQGARADGEVGP
jgi:hypothetical protein